MLKLYNVCLRMYSINGYLFLVPTRIAMVRKHKLSGGVVTSCY